MYDYMGRILLFGIIVIFTKSTWKNKHYSWRLQNSIVSEYLYKLDNVHYFDTSFVFLVEILYTLPPYCQT